MDKDDRLDELTRRLGGTEWKDQRLFLADPLVRGLAQALGVDFGEIDSQFADLERGLRTLLEAATILSPLGWVVSARNLKSSDYEAAVALWHETQDPSAVDDLLARAWTDLIWLRHSYGPMTTLAGPHEPTLELMRTRTRLVDKAVDHHMRGDYAASVLILLSQIDGLTFDFTEGTYGFFWRGQDSFFEDDHTLAGMPEFLRAVRKAVNRDVSDTTMDTPFRRHAIVHGREPAFGTPANSAKAFALMGGVIEWLEPRAKVLTARWQAEHEARYAGSKERDADGRRLDRRGFLEARKVLRRVSIREMGIYRDAGRYTDVLPGKWAPLVRLAVSDDGRRYWAWTDTASDYCFGIAGRADEVVSYLYADDGPPGPVDEDPRWVSELDEPSPDWD